MTARKLATPTNAELDANPERLRIVAKSNVEKAFYEADSKERLTDCLNTTTIRVLAAMLGELTGKSYNPEDACKEYWVARVAEYFIHIRKVRLHEKIRTHSITEIQNNPAFSQLQDLVGGMGYTTAYAILRASAAKDLKAMCKAFNLKNISRLNQKRIYARLLVDFADEYWLLYSDFDERKDDSQPDEIATAEITNASDNDNALASQPAEIANVQSDTNDNAKSLLNADYFKGKSIDEIKRAFSGASLVQLKGFALCYTIPYFSRMNKSKLIDALASKISLILEERYGYMTAENVTGDNGYAQQDDIIIPAPKPRTIPQPVSVKFIPGTVYYGNDSGNHFPVKITARTAEYVTTDFIGALIKEAKIQTIAGVEYAVFPMQYRNIEIWADKLDETKAQPEIVKFEVGKTYKSVFSQSGYHFRYKFTVIDRHEKYITVRNENNGESARRTLHIDDNGVEWVNPRGTYASQKRHVLFADAPTVEPEITAHAEVSQPEALYMDDSYSDAPGDNSCPDMDIPDDHNPLHIVQTWYGGNHSDAEICRLKRNYEAPHYKGYSIFAQFIPSVPVRFCLAKSESQALALAREYCNAFCLPCKCTDARVEKLCDYFPDWTDFLPRYMDDSLSARVFRDFHYDPLHFFRDKGIHERKNNNPPDNPGFTVVPSEHITHQDCTVYPETIIDECPYVTVPACDIPENHNSAAVVPYADFAHIRNFFRLIALYLRLWLAMNITPNKNPLDDFPDGLFTHYATRKKPRAKFRRAVFEVGSSYSASSYSTSKGLQSFTFLVTGRCVYEDTYNKRKNVMLFITCNSPDNHDFEGRGVIRFIDTDHGVEVYNHRRGYEMGCGWRVFSFRADKRDNVPFPFKNTTPGDPNYKPCGNATRFLSREFLNYSDNPDAVKEIPAEINDITPETKAQPKKRKHNPATASDIEHKLIDTKDLHFAERRKALDHNAAVISSCMFLEAVVSLLMSIPPQAIIQLGFHMRLFIAKPKGKKNVIAGLFAKRLIECRELHANVRSNPANINAKYSASVPDGVKFFETKHRQLGFIFTE